MDGNSVTITAKGGQILADAMSEQGYSKEANTGYSLIEYEEITQTKITAISAGGAHTVLLDENGAAWTFEGNNYDQLGRTENANPNLTPTKVNYKLDKVASEGSISIGNSPVKDLLISISFGLLFNKDVDVTVSSRDTLSGIAKVEVYKSDVELTKEQHSTVD